MRRTTRNIAKNFRALAALGLICAAVPAAAQPFVETERGRALQQSRGSVLLYDAAPGPAPSPMAMPPVSEAYLRAQPIPVLPQLGGPVGQPAPTPPPALYAPAGALGTPTPVDANPYLRRAPAPQPVNQQPVYQPPPYPVAQPVAQPAPRPVSGPATPPPETAPRHTSGDGRYVDGIYAIKKDYLLSWPLNAWRILSAPTRWDGDDWLTAGAIAAGAGALMLFDKNIKNAWQADIRSSGTDDFLDIVEPLGDSDLMLAGSFGGYLVSELIGAKREKAASLMLFQSVAIAGAMGEGLKHVFGRTRPAGTPSNPNPDQWDFNGLDDGDNDSFPSGHAIVGFATATVIAETYGPTNPWVPWVAYPVASLVALQRVNENRHWASDIFIGAAFGHFVSRLIVAYNPFLTRNNIALRPLEVRGGRGVSISTNF